jgi:hypothetical protein
MTVNKELLRATLKNVEEAAERGEWEQSIWRARIAPPLDGDDSCGTAMCFFGWVVPTAGREFNAGMNTITLTDDDERKITAGRYQMPYWQSGQDLHVFDWGRVQLRLTVRQAERLAYTKNTLDDLRRIVAELCEEN